MESKNSSPHVKQPASGPYFELDMQVLILRL